MSPCESLPWLQSVPLNLAVAWPLGDKVPPAPQDTDLQVTRSMSTAEAP